MKTIKINLVILSGMLTYLAALALYLGEHIVIETGATAIPLEFVGIAATCVGGVVYCAKRLSEQNHD